MGISVGTKTVSAISIGDRQISAVAVGPVEVWRGDALGLTVVEDTVEGTGLMQWEFAGAVGTWQVSVRDHYTGTSGAVVRFRFHGTNLTIKGTKDAHHGQMSVSIDGGSATTADLYAATRTLDADVYVSPTLADGPHVVTCTVLSTKNASSTGTVVSIDKAVVLATDPAGAKVTVENTSVGTGSLQWEYSAGQWQEAVTTVGTEHYSSTTNATAKVRFTGTSVELVGTKDAHHGIMSVSIDGGSAVNVDLYAAVRTRDVLLFSSTNLSNAAHTVTCTVTGTKNAASAGPVVTIDKAVLVVTESAPTLTVSSTGVASWTAVPGATDYTFERKRGTGAYTRLNGAGTALTYTDTAYQNGDVYRVAGITAAGTGAYSAAVTLTTATTAAPIWSPSLTAKSSLVLEKEDAAGGSFSFLTVDGQATMETFYDDTKTVPGVKARARLHSGTVAPQHVGLSTSLSEATLHFEMYVPKATRDSIYEYANGKCIGLGGLPDSQDGFYTSTGGSRKADSWSVRLDTATGSSYSGGSAYLIAYFYATYGNGITQATNPMYGTTKYGIWAPFVTSGSSQVSSPMSGRNVRVPVDQWFNLDVYVKMNTAGAKDGVLRCWMNGVKYVDLTDVQWIDSGTPRIDQMIWDMFVNNNSGTASGTARTRNFDLYAGEVIPGAAPAPEVTLTAPTIDGRIVGPTGMVSTLHPNLGSGITSVRLKYGTDKAVTAGVLYSTGVTPNAQGVAKHTPPALTAGTTYYYRVEVTTSAGAALDQHATVGRLVMPAAGRNTVAFNFGSCTNATDTTALAAIADRADDYFLHLGDLYYADGTGETVANFRSKIRAKLTAANHHRAMAATRTAYVASDHDGMTDDSEAGRNPTAWTNFNTVVREFLPFPFPASGHYYTWDDGPVRFIMTDGRSFKTAATATDNASKTYLGATQKQWVKDLVTGAAADQVVVFATDTPWVAAASAGSDAWEGYTTERTELANHFAASGKKVIVVCGDQHALAYEDGSAAPGGVAVFCAAPLHNAASHKGGPWDGRYPTTTGTTVQQYGRIVVTRSPDVSIEAAFKGYSAPTTERLAYTKSWTLSGGGGSAQPAFRSMTTGSRNELDAGQLTATKPSGLATGDLLFAFVNHGSGSATGEMATKPAGFTAAATYITHAGSTLYAYYKVITDAASEPASYSFAASPTNDEVLYLVAYSGVNTTTPFDGTARFTGTALASTAALSVTTTVANTRLVAFLGVDDNASAPTIGAPASMTTRANQSLTATYLHQGVFDEAVTTAAAYSRSFTYTATGGNGFLNGMMFALRPV